MTRPLLLASVALTLFAPAALAGQDKPPQPKPPRLELLTRSQDAALRRNRLRFSVQSKDGRKVTVEAELVVEGIPSDYHFNLRPQRKRLRHGEATITMKLSQRQHEVLAFGEQACMRATVNAQARVRTRADTIHERLRKSAGC